MKPFNNKRWALEYQNEYAGKIPVVDKCPSLNENPGAITSGIDCNWVVSQHKFKAFDLWKKDKINREITRF